MNTDDAGTWITDVLMAHRAECKRRTGSVPSLGKRNVPSMPIPDGVADPSYLSEFRTIREVRAELNARTRRKNNDRPTGPDGWPLRSLSVPSVGEIFHREVKKRGWEKNLASGRIVDAWPSIVGPVLAAHTTVEMFKDKKLFITCDSTAWMTSLRMHQVTVLRKISETFGPNIVEQLRVYGPKVPSWYQGKRWVKGRGPRDTWG